MTERSLEGRKIFVTGGSSGIGLATVLNLHKAGATVIIGTRLPEHYYKTLKEIQKENPFFDGERVYPFIANITSKEQIDHALDKLDQINHNPTDIIHAAAGGMENFGVPLALSVRRLRNYPPEKREEAYAKFRIKSNRWVADNQQSSEAVNYKGPRYLTDKLKGRLTRGSIVIYFSSLWSSLRGQVWVPGFYDGVASSKSRFEKWLEGRNGLKSRGIYTTIISGNSVLKTTTGDFLSELVVPLHPASDQERARATFIRKEDMVRATRMALAGEGFDKAEYHRRLFVFGPGGQISKDSQVAMAVLGMSLPI